MRLSLVPTLLLPIAIALSFTCSDKSTYPSDEHTNTFPLKIGNRWLYEEKIITVSFNIPSLADTSHIIRHRRVAAFDTIFHSIQSLIVEDTIYYQNHLGIQLARHWFVVNDTAMLEYGNGMTQPGADTLVINMHQDPYLHLRFALLEGRTWSYPLSPGTIEKTVTRYEELQCNGNSIKCDVVTTTYVAGENRQEWLTEWYSNQGLIRSISGPIRQSYHDSTGAYDSLYIYHVLDLTEYHLIE